MLPIVVLAGGLATRLRPVTETIPKSLVTINGLPFVLHQLKLFQQKGIKQVHFCLGYLGEMVEEVVKQSKFNHQMQISYSYDGDKLLGTGGAIMNAFPVLPETFFISYGDSYLTIDYKQVEAFFIQNNSGTSKGLMTVFKNEGQWDSSNVIIENNSLVLYSKAHKNERMNYIDYGLGILSKKNFVGYMEKTTFDLAEIYNKLSLKRNLLGFEVHQRFYEIGSFKGIEVFSVYLNETNE